MKNPVKKPSWWDEFMTFAVKGNAMALAVGTIIGAAFSTITKSLTDDIIMPIIAIFMGGIDFSEMKIVLPRLFGDPVLDEAGNEILNTLNYGNFISAGTGWGSGVSPKDSVRYRHHRFGYVIGSNSGIPYLLTGPVSYATEGAGPEIYLPHYSNLMLALF